MRRVTGLGRVTGAAVGGTLALALLVCGCVFTAMSGPALSLHVRSQAFHQTMASLAPTVKAVQLGASWSDFTNVLGGGQYGTASVGTGLTAGQLSQVTQDLRSGLARMPLPLGPGAWYGLSTNTATVATGAAASANLDGQPPQLEVLYRDPLTSNATLVAGSFTAGAEPAGTVAVTVTTQVAARFGLHPGSRMTLGIATGTPTLVVTGIVRPQIPTSTFWTQDPLAAQPSLVTPTGRKPYWAAGVIADPSQLAAMQSVFSGLGIELGWEFPLAVGGLNADQAQGLADALNRAGSVTPTLTGALAPAASVVNVTVPLTADLSLFLSTQAGVETVLLMLSVSLIVIAAAVILLAARMIVVRRAEELTMLRARGGSLWQVTAVLARSAVVTAVPAAVIGALLAITLIPGDAPPSGLGWLLAGITLAVALAGPALIAAWQYRRPAPASNQARIMTAETGRRRRTAWRRPVAEVTACAACAAGLVVLHDQGVPAGGQVNLLVTVAPVLVAVPVVLILLRLYPLAVRGLFRLRARRAGATGFVALSAAARSSLTGVLPAFALVLALSLAAFAGMVSSGIARGEVETSWHTTGADAVIQPGPVSGPITPAVLKAITAVRGVTHATAVWNSPWVTPFGQALTVVAVDPASYAAVTASTPDPPFPAAELGPASGTAPAVVPVLASPSAAAVLGRGATQLTSLTPVGPFSVRVVGILSDTPAQPGGGTFVVMPQLILPGAGGPPAPNMILVSGAAIDQSQLSALVKRTITDGSVSYRAIVLASLMNSPLPHGAALIVAVTLAEAAVLGLLVVVLGLALGSAERELTLARLTVLGYSSDTGLVMAEALPAVVAAAVAGAVCALVLPHLLGSSIDLSAFTGTGAAVEFQPDVTTLGLPALGAVVLAAVALAAEARVLRRRGISGILRAN